MIFMGLMILVLTVSIVFSALAQGRRTLPPTPHPSGVIPPPASPDPAPTQRRTPAPYGFTQTAWGLPTDVPLSRTSRDAIDADITDLGTELRELDFDVDAFVPTDAAQGDYTRALKAFDNARAALRSARTDAEATRITHLLEEGRHAAACARARVLGRPTPPRRPPCFFDPAHGPSHTDVAWSPVDGGERVVPACAVDVARIELGAAPRIRMVGPAGSRVPYWEDRNLAAWAQGYFGRWMNEPSLRRMTRGTSLHGGFSHLMGMLDD